MKVNVTVKAGNKFWKDYVTLIGRIINEHEAGDEDGFKEFIGFLKSNIAIAKQLYGGSLGPVPKFDIKDLYKISSDLLF